MCELSGHSAHSPPPPPRAVTAQLPDRSCCVACVVSALCLCAGRVCGRVVPCSCMAMCAVSGAMSLQWGLSCCSLSSCRWSMWSFSQLRGAASSATSDEYTLHVPYVNSREDDPDDCMPLVSSRTGQWA